MELNYRQTIGIPMGTNCATLVAGFLYVRPRTGVRSGRTTISSASEQVSDFVHESKSIKAHVYQCSYSGKHC